MKKKILLIITFVAFCMQAKPQHLYHRLDIGASNLFTFVVANLATAGLNYASNDMLFDNAYTYTWLQTGSTPSNVSAKGYNVAGLTARDLFNDITFGGKIGYQSAEPTAFNWGVFGSAHYRLNQFKTEIDGQNQLFRHTVHRLQLGGGILLKLGDIESSTRFVVEAGLRYELPISYKGESGMGTSDMLNSGLSSHFSLRINGKGAFQGLGLYADIPHYNLFKKMDIQFGTAKIKPYSFGIIYTITPWKIKDLY